ncbi:MAG: NADH-quinone oxidoreductase subunit J [Hyphomicrobiaceae bacterium]|jgi:NADH-quinone oxidoreductase subunit J
MEGLSLELLVFALLAAFAVFGAGGVAFSTHIIYSALSLMVSLLGVAGLYVMLGADFVAGVQLLVYVGGVLVLTLFAVMLTHGIQDIEVSNRSAGRPMALVLVGAVFTVMVRGVLAVDWKIVEEAPAKASTHGIGDALLGTYILPFEVASLVLLAVLVGAVVLTRKEVV